MRSRALIQFIVIYVLSVAVFLFLLFLNFFPVRWLFDDVITPSTKIYDRNGILLYETLHPEQGKTTHVALADMPKPLINATIATEDSSFYKNRGIDFKGIVRAVLLNIRAGRVVSGGSTITQQLVRNVIGVNRERTFLQKIKESILALRVAKVFEKDEILELYLNKIYYGNLNYGAAAASFGYFGKTVHDLDLAESAFLAGLPQAPNRYDPFLYLEDALKRKDHVLSLMRKHGFIVDAAFEEAKSEQLAFEQNLVTVKAPHFVNFVIEELENRFGGAYVTAGLEVQTTIDYHLYEKVQEIARSAITRLVGRNVTNASVVVLDPQTAEILVMLGSVDYFDQKIDGQVNIATSLRQPGSAMKPITYAVAFERGWNGVTVLKDEPVRFFTADGTPYLPKNYDFEYHGDVTIREALANSYNIPAVKTIDFTGVESVLQKARAFGLTSLNESADHYGLALTLGDGEVRLLDLTSAYMVFANSGMQKTPEAILEIKDVKGNTIYSKDIQLGQRVLAPEISFMITDILADNNARLPEFGLNNILELDRPAAAKTGTTRNFRDNWTIGYTPDYVVGVWVGNTDSSKMHDVSGIYGAGPIWHDVMTEVHRGKEKKQFTVPPGVEKRTICVAKVAKVAPQSGEETEKCGKSVAEWILQDALMPRCDNGGDPAAAGSQCEASKPLLRIVKPFDLDEFEFKPDISPDTQQIKLQAEKGTSVDEVTWLVNGQEVGKGDEIFWPLQVGKLQIQAVAGEIMSESIHIFVK